MNTLGDKLKAFERMLNIMDDLCAQCPWDREQSNESLRQLTIEETYELADAVIAGNPDEIKKELGDLFLHILFYSKIGSEKQQFDIADVMNGIAEKLIYRHPHIYADTKVESAEDVRANWEALKLKEKSQKKQSVLGGIPKSLPALVKAVRLQEKASGIGFDWDNREQIWDKVAEELNELQVELKAGNTEKAEAEFGDLLFALINMARLYGIRPDNALEKTNQKFIKRFNYIESQTIMKGKSLQDMTVAEMDVFWNEAKQLEKSENK